MWLWCRVKACEIFRITLRQFLSCIFQTFLLGVTENRRQQYYGFCNGKNLEKLKTVFKITLNKAFRLDIFNQMPLKLYLIQWNIKCYILLLCESYSFVCIRIPVNIWLGITKYICWCLRSSNCFYCAIQVVGVDQCTSDDLTLWSFQHVDTAILYITTSLSCYIIYNHLPLLLMNSILLTLH